MAVPRRCFFCGSFLLCMFHVCLCCAVLVVPCSLVNTCWERADLLTLLYVMFSCVFVTFPYYVLRQVWYLIVWIPDHCPLSYFHFSFPHILWKELFQIWVLPYLKVRYSCTVSCIFPGHSIPQTILLFAYFLISETKYVLWVLKRTLATSQLF